MKTINPEDIKIIKGLPPKATKSDRVAVDLEIFNMDERKMHRPTGEFASLQATFDGETAYIITDVKDVPRFLQRLDAAVLIFQNAKFDVFHLRRWADFPMRQKLWDTLLIEKIMWSGYYDNFSLADMARRYLDIYLEKDTRKEFENHESFELTRSQLEYACIDVIVTWRIYKAQKEIVCDKDLELWADIDLPALWTVLAMSPMRLDVKAWEKLAKQNQSDADAIAKKYPNINLGSPDQVGKEIIRQGYNLPKTPTGKPSTVEDDLKSLIDRSQFVRDVLEFRGKSKAASTYGINWITNYVEEDDLVYSNFIVNGAATGRFSSREPNVENIPIRETPEFRKCFIARPKKVLIDADWSAQEPRIAAYLSCDEKLLKIFQDKKDVYIESAWLMFKWKIDKKDPRRKTRMKPTVLGASYGLTEYGMEKKYQVPKKEGKELLDKFFQTFDGMREWKERQQKIKTYVTTIYGRKYWLNSYAKGSENNALNSPVQGSASDAMKIAGYRFMQKWGWVEKDSPIINFVHDEILLDAVTSTAADYFVIDSTLTNEQLQTICTQLITALETDTLNRFLASKAIAKAIPNWATWTQSDWATYFDANLSDAQADLVTSFPAARVMIKRQNLVIQNLVKLLIAIRDDIWPDLPEP